MHIDILPTGYNKIIEKISKYPFIKNFYLSGGTALALQIGHRESIDFDFFTENEFNPEDILRILKIDFEVSDLTLEKGTLNCTIGGIKLQFLHYPYTLLEKFIDWNGINISSIIDIACTKMITVSARGNKKDFIDIYYLLQKYNLDDIFLKMDEKYKNIDFNKTHILKSLTSFNDAEEQPMPKMHTEIDWLKIKSGIELKAVEYLKNIDL